MAAKFVREELRAAGSDRPGPIPAAEPQVDLPSSATFKFSHLPQLDGFRGFAVLLVVFGHLLHYSPLNPVWTSIGETAETLGVFLFFVLSGFLITSLLHKERIERSRIHFSRFYVRRALRLGPALLLFLFTVVVLTRMQLVHDAPPRELLASLFYFRNFMGRGRTLAHLWSLSLEEQFYLCWPLTFALLPMRRAALLTAGIATTIAIWRGLAIHFALFPYGTGIYYMRPYFRFDSMLIGAALALAIATSASFYQLALRCAQKLPAALPLLALMVWSYWGESWSKPLYLTVQEILIATALGQLVLRKASWTLTIFSNRLLCYFGTISYALYLWQQLFLVSDTPSWGNLRAFPLKLVIPVLIAILSYHLIEKRFTQLKSRFS